MTDVANRDIPLNWDVFVTPGIPVVNSDLPPGMNQRMWSPISATLIYSNRDAVLSGLAGGFGARGQTVIRELNAVSKQKQGELICVQ